MPRLIVVGGPNGSGKTSFARALEIDTYVNPDALQAALDTGRRRAAHYDAGREALQLIERLMERRADFGWETTMAGHGPARRIEAARRLGYQVVLHFIWLPTLQNCEDRIRARVATTSRLLTRAGDTQGSRLISCIVAGSSPIPGRFGIIRVANQASSRRAAAKTSLESSNPLRGRSCYAKESYETNGIG